MKKTVCILCVFLFLIGCSSLRRTVPGKTERPQEQANPKVAAPIDIHYPKSPSIEDHGAQIAIINNNPVDGTLLSGCTNFPQESFSVILKTASDNVNYSPLGLYYPLMMTPQASEKQTTEQLQTLLHVDSKDSAKNMGNLYHHLYTDNKSGQLKIVSSSWIQDSYPINKGLTETANKQFYAATYDVDSSQARTADLMTAWICEYTNGNLSPSIRTNESMRTAILNAVYYKVRFDTEFDKKDTEKDIFHAQDGKVDTDFMHKEMGFRFFTDNKGYATTSLTLGNPSNLTLVLSKEGKDIRRMMEQKGFLQELLKDGTEGADFGIVELSLPKFEVRSKLQFVDTLRAMGVTSLFDIAAELNDITNEKSFFVPDIRQGASIAPGEEGTEASTYTMIGTTGAVNMEHPKVLDLDLNRPLLCAISAHMDGIKLPLFIGVCSNPAP